MQQTRNRKEKGKEEKKRKLKKERGTNRKEREIERTKWYKMIHNDNNWIIWTDNYIGDAGKNAVRSAWRSRSSNLYVWELSFFIFFLSFFFPFFSFFSTSNITRTIPAEKLFSWCLKMKKKSSIFSFNAQILFFFLFVQIFDSKFFYSISVTLFFLLFFFVFLFFFFFFSGGACCSCFACCFLKGAA